MQKKYRNLFFFVPFLMVASIALGQEKVKPKHKFKLFKYNKHDFPFTIDAGGGIGPSNVRFQVDTTVSLDIYHIMIGYRSISKSTPRDLLDPCD